MDWFSGFVLYWLIWWVTIFCVLNIGHRTADAPPVGHAKSAPVKLNLGKKLLWNSLLAAAVWLVVWLVVTYGGFSFTEAVAGWE